MSLWPVILGVAVGSFLLRASFLSLVDPARVPARVRRVLPFAPAAVLGALLASSLHGPVAEGAAGPGGGLARLGALVLAGLAAWWTESVLVTLLAGMAMLWTLTALT